MDIERFKQITVLMIKSGIKVKQARDEIKEYKYERQDLHSECLSETFKPFVDVQKETKNI